MISVMHATPGHERVLICGPDQQWIDLTPAGLRLCSPEGASQPVEVKALAGILAKWAEKRPGPWRVLLHATENPSIFRSADGFFLAAYPGGPAIEPAWPTFEIAEQALAKRQRPALQAPQHEPFCLKNTDGAPPSARCDCGEDIGGRY